MLGRNVAWGIDIGEFSIKAVKLRRVKDTVEVLGYDVIERAVGPEQAEALDKDGLMRAALTTFLSRNRVQGTRVAVTVPGPGFDRFIGLPSADHRRIPELVHYEARQQIPFPLNEVCWDYQTVQEEPAPGQEIEVALFAIKNQIIHSFLNNLALCDLGVDVVEMGRLALYNFVRYDQAPEKGTLVVDIGAGTTDLVLIEGDHFRVRSIPLGGAEVTRTLQKKFQLSFDEAEDLKQKAPQSAQAQQLSAVMRPLFERLTDEIQKTIGYYKAQFQTMKVERILLLGNGFRVPGVPELFQQRLNCPVVPLRQLEQIELAEDVDEAEFLRQLPSFGVALGLALQALDRGPVRINMIPGSVAAQRALAKKRPLALSAVAALVLGVVALYAWSSISLGRVSGALEQVRSFLTQIQPQQDAIEKALNLSALRRQLQRPISDLGKNRGRQLEILNQLAAEVLRPVGEPTLPGTKKSGIILINRIDLRTQPFQAERESAAEHEARPGVSRKQPEMFYLRMVGWTDQPPGSGEVEQGLSQRILTLWREENKHDRVLLKRYDEALADHPDSPGRRGYVFELRWRVQRKSPAKRAAARSAAKTEA